MIALLIDPDKCTEPELLKLVENPAYQGVDFLFVGGSLITSGNMEDALSTIRSLTDKECVIFPGGPEQINDRADAILLLSLISGRNPDLLIGKHVESAFRLKQSGLEVISTGYILLDGGRTTTVSYISNTTPIPQDKAGIATSTAVAGEMIGNKLIYLDCGSGAMHSADPSLVKKVSSNVSIPVVVGGGIRTKEQAEALFEAGADIIVVGNKLEEDPDFLEELVLSKAAFTQTSAQTP